MAGDVKNFITNLEKPFADMKMRKTALLAKFLSIIDTIADVQHSEAKALNVSLKRLQAPEKARVAKSIAAPATAPLAIAAPKTPESLDTGMEHNLRVTLAAMQALVGTVKPPSAEETKAITPPAVGTQQVHAALISQRANEEQVNLLQGILKAVTPKEKEKKKEKEPEAAAEVVDKKTVGIVGKNIGKLLDTIGEHIDKISGTVDAFHDSLIVQVAGALSGIALQAKGTAMTVLKHFGNSMKDSMLQKKQWALEKIDSIKQWKLFTAIEKHTGIVGKLQKAQMWMQSFIGTFAAIMQMLLGTLIAIISSVAKYLMLGMLANVLAGALDKVLQKYFPHKERTTEEKIGATDLALKGETKQVDRIGKEAKEREAGGGGSIFSKYGKFSDEKLIAAKELHNKQAEALRARQQELYKQYKDETGKEYGARAIEKLTGKHFSVSKPGSKVDKSTEATDKLAVSMDKMSEKLDKLETAGSVNVNAPSNVSSVSSGNAPSAGDDYFSQMFSLQGH